MLLVICDVTGFDILEIRINLKILEQNDTYTLAISSSLNVITQIL